MSSPADEGKVIITVSVIGLILFGIGVIACMGPAGVKTSLSGWYASGYGSDWLVVQYAQSGCVIHSWDLQSEAIKNEGSSDGIYFVTEEGPVVHLSGHYTYIQNPTKDTLTEMSPAGNCEGPQ